MVICELSKVRNDGERKYVTILFADVVRSTELLAGLDLELQARTLDRLTLAIKNAVNEYGGVISAVEGDGVLALFGAPLAQEDHALRACMAAQRIHRHFAARHPGVRIRVGISSGEVILRFLETDLCQEYRASGMPLTAAKRMQQHSGPGETLVTGDVYRKVRSCFAATPIRIGEVRDSPCYRLERSLDASWNLLEMPGALIGRRDLVDGIHQRLTAAAGGRTQLLSLRGDAGVGKSTLVRHALASHGGVGLVLTARLQSYLRQTAHSAVELALRSWLEAGRDDRPTDREAEDRISALIGKSHPHRVSALMSLARRPVDCRRWNQLGPEKRHRYFELAFGHFMEAVGEGRVTALVIDNAHWMDPASEALLKSLLKRGPDQPLAVVIISREGRQFGQWPELDGCTGFEVPLLDREQAGEYITERLGTNPGMDCVAAFIGRNCEGNPLYIEETIVSLVELGVLAGSPGNYEAAAGKLGDEPPPGLRALLSAKLDALSVAERDLLHALSVAGVRADAECVRRLLGESEMAFRLTAGSLRAKGILDRAPDRSGTQIGFRSELLRDVAYSQLLENQKQRLHALVLDYLESSQPHRVRTEPELFAHHADRASLADKSAYYHQRAADEMLERFQHDIALRHLEKAMAALTGLGEPVPLGTRVDLEMRLRRTHSILGNNAESLTGINAVKKDCLAVGNLAYVAEIETFRSIESSHHGRLDAAIRQATCGMALARSIADPALECNAGAAKGLAEFHAGRYRAAGHTLGDVLEKLGGEHQDRRFGATTTVAVRCNAMLSGCATAMGRYGAARAHASEAIAIGRRLNRPLDKAMGRYFLGLAQLECGEFEAALEVLEAGFRSEAGQTYLKPWFESEIGLAMARLGEPGTAAALTRAAVESAGSKRMYYGLTRALLRRCEVLCLAGRPAAAAIARRHAQRLASKHAYRGLAIRSVRLLAQIECCGAGIGARLIGSLERARMEAFRLGMQPDIEWFNRYLESAAR